MALEAAHILYTLDLFGVAVFAVSGALAAARKRMDVFGMVVLGLVTALGGGTLRDTLLDSGPVFWINDPVYLLVAIVFSLLTFFAVRFFSSHKLGLLISDAFGLAIFTGIGTSIALMTTDSKSVAIFMGVMTGTAGGMLRDILSAEVPLILRREIYATAALCGSSAFVVMKIYGFAALACLVVSVTVTLLIRLAAIRWKLSLPVLQTDDIRDKY
ncbi:MAG: trimeric intracellular cation channel family protein [Desulfobulbaceae bacterium]|nr:trimeric intracellular cation channel family protein [Desulfobulbaceae bacterium]